MGIWGFFPKTKLWLTRESGLEWEKDYTPEIAKRHLESGTEHVQLLRTHLIKSLFSNYSTSLNCNKMLPHH